MAKTGTKRNKFKAANAAYYRLMELEGIIERMGNAMRSADVEYVKTRKWATQRMAQALADFFMWAEKA